MREKRLVFRTVDNAPAENYEITAEREDAVNDAEPIRVDLPAEAEMVEGRPSKQILSLTHFCR